MMRRRRRIAALVAALAATSAASADTIDIDGVKRSYTVQLPAKRLVPLVVVLHGKTQRGADITRSNNGYFHALFVYVFQHLRNDQVLLFIVQFGMHWY